MAADEHLECQNKAKALLAAVPADTTTFIMLACGRIDPQEQIDAGRISWRGDEAWGEKAARNLRFTM